MKFLALTTKPTVFIDDPNGVNCKGAEDTNRTDLIRSLSSDAIEATWNNVQSLNYAERTSSHGSELLVGPFGNTVLVRLKVA